MGNPFIIIFTPFGGSHGKHVRAQESVNKGVEFSFLLCFNFQSTVASDTNQSLSDNKRPKK